jgi:hypothetical protein
MLCLPCSESLTTHTAYNKIIFIGFSKPLQADFYKKTGGFLGANQTGVFTTKYIIILSKIAMFGVSLRWSFIMLGIAFL